MPLIIFIFLITFNNFQSQSDSAITLIKIDSLTAQSYNDNSLKFSDGESNLDQSITLDRLISLIAILLTFLTTILIYRTLREMQNQRKSSYRPEVGFVSKYYFYEFDKELKIKKGYEESYYSNLNKKYAEELNIQIFNLGFASAKEVKIHWEIDVKKLKRFFLDNQIKDTSINIIEKESTIKISINDKNFNFFKPIDMLLAYLLPVTVKHKTREVQVPDFYNFLFTVYTKYIFEFGDDPKKFPSLKMKCEYLNIDNDKTTKYFDLVPQFYWGTSSSNYECFSNFFYNIIESSNI